LALVACQQPEPPAADAEQPSFADIESGSTLLAGLLDFYRDNESGELYLRLSSRQLQQGYLHFATYLDGNLAMNTYNHAQRLRTLWKHQQGSDQETNCTGQCEHDG
jgi:hypothetical protein